MFLPAKYAYLPLPLRRSPDGASTDCVCVRVISLFSYEDGDPVQVTSRHIRPRACHKLHVADVAIGSRVMVNYNYDEPKSRGYWYDAVVTAKHVTRTVKQLTTTVFIG